MELKRQVIKVGDRNLTFVGTVTDDTMDVMHVIDPARSNMQVFHHIDAMGKSADKPFDCSIRRKADAAARKKHGIGKVIGFPNYSCKLGVVTDENGNNTVTITNINTGADLSNKFITVHWG